MAGIGDWIAQILDLVQGAQGRDLNRASTAADIADPFRSQRGQYQDALSQLLGDKTPSAHQTALDKLLNEPGSFEMDPGAQFAMDQGLEGVARHGNSMFGTTRSGNTAIELEKYATGFAGDKYSERVNQLTHLSDKDQSERDTAIDQLLLASGAKTGSPAAAADAYLGGFKNQDRRLGSGLSGDLFDGILGPLASLLGQGAGAAGDFFKNLFPNGAPNLGGNVDEFLASIGLGSGGGSPWGADSDLTQQFRNIFSQPGEPTLADFKPWETGGDIDESTRNLLGGLFPGGNIDFSFEP